MNEQTAEISFYFFLEIGNRPTVWCNHPNYNNKQARHQRKCKRNQL